MAKHVNVTTGDYVITVENGADIVLNTGDQSLGAVGNVRVTGDLFVAGTTTTVNSQDLVVEDNIIVLNKNGADNSGIIPNPAGERIAGIEIDRGTFGPRAQWVFDENATTLYDSGTNVDGAWVSRDDDGNRRGIEVASITTPGINLVLIGGTTSGPNPGVVTVAGTVDYADRVAQYGDDAIPNKRYVDDKIQEVLNTAFQDTIAEGTFAATTTRIEVRDDTVTGNPSEALIAIDGDTIATFKASNAEIYDLRITGNKIESIQTNQDLVFTAEGTGRVVVDDSLLLTKTPHNSTGINNPDAPTNGTLLYSKAEGTGETGVYFVNEAGTRDELISKNRALVYSMLF